MDNKQEPAATKDVAKPNPGSYTGREKEQAEHHSGAGNILAGVQSKTPHQDDETERRDG